MQVFTGGFLILTAAMAGCGSNATNGRSAPTDAVPASALASAAPDRGKVAPHDRPTADVEFKAALDLKQKATGFEPQLRKGTVANSDDWPASLYATFTTPQGAASCTAALLGPSVMLTAAHCVPTSGRVRFRFGGRSYETLCATHPRYAAHRDDSADYALCKLAEPLAAPAGFYFESVDTSSMNAFAGQTVLLTGFGCTSDVPGGSIDGNYRIGSTKIQETSASTPPGRGPDFAEYYVPRQVNNLFTSDDPDMANLCPGDSGGPAFRLTTAADRLTRRLIVGVNSRVFYADAAGTRYGASLISATGGPDFRPWAEEWLASGGVAACGLAGNVPNCRN